jgi:hypothetical protein
VRAFKAFDVTTEVGAIEFPDITSARVFPPPWNQNIHASTVAFLRSSIRIQAQSQTAVAMAAIMDSLPDGH